MQENFNNSENGRETFGSRLGFILVSAGCAVGLGNVWKFPYICGEYGGAAFIVIYLIFLVSLGYPILTCEFAIGRGSGLSIGGALKKLEPKGTIWHKFRWFGFAANYLLMMFYTMVAGWMLNYVYLMGTGKLTGDTEMVAGHFSDMLASPKVMIFWTILVVVVCIGVCALGLQNGVEKISKVMMSLLIVLLIAMAIHSVTLKNASEGLKFYLVPDINRMIDQGIGNVLFAAMTHAFFTLSVGIGSMEIFGSFLNKDRKLTGEAGSVVILDTVIALIAGIIIIPACFSCGVTPDSGPSLLFITLPNVFNNMAGGRIWGTCFFVFMSFAALSTVIAVFQNIISMAMDLTGISKAKSVVINLIGLAALSTPAVLGFNILSDIHPLGGSTNIMDLEDFIVSYNVLPLGSLLFVLFCVSKNGWGFDNFVAEVDTGIGRPFPRWIKGYLNYILPLIILVVYFKGYYDMFKEKPTPIFATWMGISVVFASFIMYLAFRRKE